ncbi:MAG: methyltransferase domain-containing protein [Armatimonadetes bacterium]|nr:methyltransferase domain-containing protein [Armatimonadota bacterium]
MTARIFWISVLILFVEMLVIRWYASEVRIFAYLHSLVLLAVFLGMGLGCYASDRRAWPVASAAVLAGLVILVEDPINTGWRPLQHITDDLGSLSQVYVWYQEKPAIVDWLALARGLFLLLGSFLAIAFVFFPLGQLMGRWMNEPSNAIRAYSANILGSLAGVWIFNALCFAWLPPAAWFAVALLLYLIAMPDVRTRVGTAGLLGLAMLAALHPPAPAEKVVWSPYHKLILREAVSEPDNFKFGYHLEVNGVWYQGMVNLSSEWLQKHPEKYDAALLRSSWYVAPWVFKKAPKSVLIVGAGSGNDVASALRAGAEHVVAVEIDPAIVALGRQFHPEQPYSDPRVEVVVDDARAYFKRSTEKFDAIRFALLDSHTQVSGLNNLRLDNYVYTREAFQEAAALLKPDGVLFCGFALPKPFVGYRLDRLLMDIFGHLPLLYSLDSGTYTFRYGASGALFIASTRADQERMMAAVKAVPEVAARTSGSTATARVVPTTDDWPYLYLEQPTLPAEYVTISILVLLTLWILKRILFAGGERVDPTFFLLGAAFLLLEVHAISRAMLLFGSTWVVNSFVITAVLLFIFLANCLAERLTRRAIPLIYGLLLGTLLINLLVPLSAFQNFPLATRAFLSSLFLCAPVFFAGLIFVKQFEAFPRRNVALGSNLIGAIVGGMLESLTFLWGMRIITVLVIGLYAASWLTLRRGNQA